MLTSRPKVAGETRLGQVQYNYDDAFDLVTQKVPQQLCSRTSYYYTLKHPPKKAKGELFLIHYIHAYPLFYKSGYKPGVSSFVKSTYIYIIYQRRAIITRSWLETNLEYYPYIKAKFLKTLLQKVGLKYTNRGL